ncbi:aminoacyl-tRNA hydrolase [Chelatococcus caeni]|nr:aminoacyl-tRNA hydrolase [Chelatococcus caeni]
MLLFVGLGNPGARYARNRHNIGFMAVDEIARRHNAGPWRRRFQSEVAEAVVGGERLLLMKPQTYMNESGRAVGEAQRFFKVALADIVVFHDELDLAPAKLRIKTGGGIAGHNGLRSISAHVGNDYRRVRLGIGHPGDKALVHSYVLNDFAKAEEPWVEDLTGAVAEFATLLARGEDASFQNKVHLAMDARGWGDVKRPGERAGG